MRRLLIYIIVFLLFSQISCSGIGTENRQGVGPIDEGTSLTANENETDVDIGGEQGIPANSSFESQPVTADIPVTLVKLDAQKISVEIAGGESHQRKKFTPILAAFADDAMRYYLVGKPGVVDAESELILEKDDGDYLSFIVGKSGFSLLLPADYMDRDLRLYHSHGDVAATELTVRVEKSGYLIAINTEPGIHENSLYCYNDRIYYNQNQNGKDAIVLQSIHGGGSKVFGYSNLLQMYYFPEKSRPDATTMIPEHILGLSREGDVIDLQYMGEPIILNDYENKKRMMAELTVRQLISASHVPHPSGNYTVYYGNFKLEGVPWQSPLMLVPGLANVSDIMLTDESNFSILSRDLAWKSSSNVLSLTVYQDKESALQVHGASSATKPDPRQSSGGYTYVAEIFDLGLLTSMNPAEIDDYVRKNPESAEIDPELVFISDKPLRKPVVSHQKIVNVLGEEIEDEDEFFVFQYKDDNGSWQPAISDYEKYYSLANGHGGVENISISLYNDFIAYDVIDKNTGLKTIMVKNLATQSEFALFDPKSGESVEVFNPVFSGTLSHSLSYFIKDDSGEVSVGVLNLLYHPKVKALKMIPVTETPDGDVVLDTAAVISQIVDYSHLTTFGGVLPPINNSGFQTLE